MRQYAHLAEILETRYGVGPLIAPMVAVVWAAEALAAEVGKVQADKEFGALARRREKAGRPTAHGGV